MKSLTRTPIVFLKNVSYHISYKLLFQRKQTENTTTRTGNNNILQNKRTMIVQNNREIGFLFII